MIVTCPTCSARFQYDEARFHSASSKRFRCPKCSAEFEVANPSLASQGMAIPPSPIPPPAAPMAQTTTRRDRSAMLAAAGLVGDAAGMPPGKRFTLAFLSGPYASTVRVLEKPTTVIGREEGEILTMDPETSRRHAQIEINPDAEVWLSDLGSTNGTSVEGQLIDGRVQLMDRQEFTCGKSTFMLMIRNDDTYGLD